MLDQPRLLSGGVLQILREVAAGRVTPVDAERDLRSRPTAQLAERVVLDVDRQRRTGIPEVILASPKRPADVAAIVTALLAGTGSACVSRMRAGHRAAVDAAAAAAGATVVRYGRRSVRVIGAGAPQADPSGQVGLIAAGTSDIEPLEEARMVCEAVGCATVRVVDVGVAGLHRLFEPLSEMVRSGADAIVVAAGMDGALPSVVAGIVAIPVIGLPTSNGYGAGGGGEAALLAMLQSCAPGLVVVNIDNGVGAGAAAAQIAVRRWEAARTAAAP
jgi:NCAIR mutase (PurE)-related protein